MKIKARVCVLFGVLFLGIHSTACPACYGPGYQDEEFKLLKMYKQKLEKYGGQTYRSQSESLKKSVPCDFSKGNDNCKPQK
jgi:hypothetical protein